MTITTWPAASGILQICQFLICSRLLWENDSASYVENYLSHLLWADNKGDDHQHQAVPHVQHQANLNQQFYQNWLLVNLNKEDEDDAEPPEFHCSENCAKDVALRSFSLSSWYISQGSPAQLLFICSLLYLSILSCGFCWKLPERLRRDPRGCSEWSHLIKIIFEELTITNMVDMN